MSGERCSDRIVGVRGGPHAPAAPLGACLALCIRCNFARSLQVGDFGQPQDEPALGTRRHPAPLGQFSVVAGGSNPGDCSHPGHGGLCHAPRRATPGLTQPAGFGGTCVCRAPPTPISRFSSLSLFHLFPSSPTTSPHQQHRLAMGAKENPSAVDPVPERMGGRSWGVYGSRQGGIGRRAGQ